MAITLSTLPGGRGRLLPRAAASITRIDKQRGKPLSINSAYRSNAEQEALKARWLRGGTLNRPPYLYKPAWNPPYPHSTGLFIDTSDITWMLTFGRAHGWRRTVASDSVHFGYFIALDTKADPDPNWQRYYCTDGEGKGWYYLVGHGEFAGRTRWSVRYNRWKRVYGDGGRRTFARLEAIRASGKQA